MRLPCITAGLDHFRTQITPSPLKSFGDVAIADESMLADPFIEKASNIKAATLAVAVTVTFVALIILTALAATGQLPFAMPFATAIASNPGAIAGLAIGAAAIALCTLYTGYKASKLIHHIVTYDNLATFIFPASEIDLYDTKTNAFMVKGSSTLTSTQVITIINAINRKITGIPVPRNEEDAYLAEQTMQKFVTYTWLHYKCELGDPSNKMSHFIRHIYACNCRHFKASKLAL